MSRLIRYCFWFFQCSVKQDMPNCSMLGGLWGKHKRPMSRPKRLQPGCACVRVWVGSCEADEMQERWRNRAPSPCYSVGRNADLPRVSHFRFKKQESCLLPALFWYLLRQEKWWEESGVGRRRRREMTLVILSWFYLKHFRVMRSYSVSVCALVCVCWNTKKLLLVFLI